MTWLDAVAARSYRVPDMRTNETIVWAANYGALIALSALITGSDQAVEGEWRWMAGPEAGMQFSQGAAATAPFSFVNWGSIEPNNHLNA